MTILGCSFALAGAQMVPLLYLTLGTTIAYELEADGLTIWMFTSIIVAQGTLAPFVGPLADLCGRKFIFLVLLGIGVIVQELLSIAIVVESVPTAKRSLANSLGLKRRELVRRIDVIGGLLLTAGLLCVLVGLNWGGQDYAWNSSHVLSALIIGGGMLLGFALYECFVAPYPLFPRRIVQAPRPFFCMLYVIFAAGINYMPLVALWPIETIAVFQADRSQ
ncbi:hypothetical protein BUE80_DR013893, partial [Diplocarpon rosae]